MPIIQVLKPVYNADGYDIEKDAPRKFTNIDKEGFEFTWDGIPFGGMFPERMKLNQEQVAGRAVNDKGFVETMTENKTVYEFLKPILPGETVTMPKYLVNYAAMHLARKIYKREAFAAFQGTEMEKRNAAIKFVNPEEEMKLMKKMVAANFPEEKVEEAVMPTAESVIDKTQVEKAQDSPLKCETCGFISKSELGLKAHRRKHK